MKQKRSEATAMRRKDWTLLVLAARNGAAMEPVHLQKSLFLLSANVAMKDLRVSSFYAFSAYDYGPFSSTIYSDVESLEDEGLAKVARGGAFKTYAATDCGLTRAAKLRAALKDTTLSYLDKVVMWVCSLSFQQLVSAIYRAYPKMRVNSVFRE